MRSYFLIVTSILFIGFLIWLNNFSKHDGFSVGNLHTHTLCSDGENSYEENINEAIKLKFDFIAITDHEFCPEIIKKCQEEKRILCIAGQEVTTSRTHLVALNIKSKIDPKLPLKKQVEESEGKISITGIPGDTQPAGKMDFGLNGREVDFSIWDPRVCRYADYSLSLDGGHPEIAAAFARLVEEIADIIKKQNALKGDTPK